MFGSKTKRMVTVELPKYTQKAITYLIDQKTTGHLKFGNAQIIGDRSDQQDSFGCSNVTNQEQITSNGIMAVLADGMGGLSNGRKFSDYVVKEVLSRFSSIDKNDNIATQIENMIDEVNSLVCENLVGNNLLGGTTLSALYLYQKNAYWINVGDSRIYLKRDNMLFQLNEDHDYHNQLLTEYIFGNCDLRDAVNDPQKDALTSYIGNPQLPYIDFNRRPFLVKNGDTFLLCSDGVYNALGNDELLAFMMKEPQAAAEKIVKNVEEKKMPSQDNATVMLVEIKY